MLVILSDVHLTDGTSGTIIKPTAFKKFMNILRDVIGEQPPKEDTAQSEKKGKIEQVHLVLLGDIFDVIRSEEWVRKDPGARDPVRPWSPAAKKDINGQNLQDYTEEIVDKIIRYNQEAIGYLKNYKEFLPEGVKMDISYLIGNHDWLINRYPSTRKAIAEFLGMPDPDRYLKELFPLDKEFPAYGVLTRHGDCYDLLNYSGDRDASSWGDALVIDLLNHFPLDVKDELQLKDDDPLFVQLKEIDNVRPLLEIPAWIKGVCRRNRPGKESEVHDKWNDLVKKFFKLPVVKEFAKTERGLATVLRLGLGVTSWCSFDLLMKILANNLLSYWFHKSDDYKAFAFKEKAVKDDRVKYAVYGHTHFAEQVPLDVAQNERKNPGIEKIYFNSGTWRRIFEHTAYDRLQCEFVDWQVLTFLVFYLPSEKEPDRNYEVWSASLG
jgi:UDP-2,3-diacylglucosamine pyrophosphatase LpxH